MTYATTITNTGIDWAKIVNSKYVGFAIFAGSLLAGFGIVEFSSAISKSLEKGYNMEAGSEKYGTLKFTVPTTIEESAESKQLHEKTEQAENEETNK